MKYVIGGIGDFLQIIDSAQEGEEKILVYSHQGCAGDFFKGLEIDAEIESFSKWEQTQNDFRISINRPLERKLYQDFDLPKESEDLALRLKKEVQGKEILGIHPVGSDFSNDFWGEHGVPLKKMPFNFFKDLVSLLSKDFHLLVFGTTLELREEYRIPLAKSDFKDKITWVSCEYIWDSLAHVLICDKVVAIDSAIKTMASVKNIPSVVFVGNYEDKMRDDLFLDPYIADGVMKVIKFSDLNEQKIKELKLCLE